MNKQKIKFLKWQLSAAFVLLAVVLAVGFFIFTPLSWQQVARALTGDYNKNSGSQLTVSDWNNLDDDFLDKSGDTMSGDLNMGNHNISSANSLSANSISANSLSVNGDLNMNSHNINNVSSLSSHTVNGDLNMGNNHITNLAAPVNDNDAVNLFSLNNKIINTNGDSLKVVCGQSSLNWVDNTGYPESVYIDIDTRVNGNTVFSNTPVYFTSLSCTAACWRSMGVNAIYDATPSSFRVYIQNDGDPITLTAANAVANNWIVRWCGVGN